MSPNQTCDTTNADIKGKGPAKKNSEVRKEQNRIASRNYREKRRQKLALLDEILKTEDSSEQSVDEEPSESDGGGSTAGGSGWELNNAHIPTDECFTQGLNDAPPEWDAWLPPAGEASEQQPGTALLGAMPDPTWPQFTGLGLGEQLAAVPGVFGNLTDTPNLPNEVFQSSTWPHTITPADEHPTASKISGYDVPFDEACAAEFNDRDLACIINRVRNLSPSQKWALISLLQQDANYPQGSTPMHFRRQADSS